MVTILTWTREAMMYFKYITIERSGHSHEEKKAKLVALISSKEPDHKDAIVDYLKNGELIIRSWGVMHDLLQADTPRVGPGIDTFTDGIWAWTQEIVYYVKVYNLQLPKEFLARMEALHWKVPKVGPFTLQRRNLAEKRMLWKTWRPAKGDIS
jgi:hypothetical protein